MQALAQSEHCNGDAEHDRRLGPRQPASAGHDGEEGSSPDDPHEREPAQAALALDELDDRELRQRDDAGEDEPQDADRGLAHVCGVLCERR